MKQLKKTKIEPEKFKVNNEKKELVIWASGKLILELIEKLNKLRIKYNDKRNFWNTFSFVCYIYISHIDYY